MCAQSKGGRPRKSPEQLRSKSVTVKFDDGEYSRITALATSARKPRSAYIRESALQGRVSAIATPWQWALLKDIRLNLRNIGININSLAKYAHIGLNEQQRRSAAAALEQLSILLDSYQDKLSGL